LRVGVGEALIHPRGVPTGVRHRIVNPGFTFVTMPDRFVVTVPPIERIDYLALAATA
jgi:hypothetical protein